MVLNSHGGQIKWVVESQEGNLWVWSKVWGTTSGMVERQGDNFGGGQESGETSWWSKVKSEWGQHWGSRVRGVHLKWAVELGGT